MILQHTLIVSEGSGSVLRSAVGRDWKGRLSVLLYVVAMVATAWRAWIAQAIYAAVALLWLVPDRRIERAMIGGASSASSSDDRAR